MQLIALLLMLFSIPILIFSQIVDHLKKIDNKTGIHKFENIDFIYMINLDQRPEKWELSNKQLNPYGIFPYRFSAVNGWELSLATINDVGVRFNPMSMIGGYLGTSFNLDGNFERDHSIIEKEGQVYFCHRIAKGTIGIVLSHLSVLRDALDSNYETIWIMEDDVEVLSDPRKIPQLIEQLNQAVGKNNWDILFTDRNIRSSSGIEVPARGMAKRPNFNPENTDQYYICEQINDEFIRLGARFGAHSMILQRSGIKKIYDFIIKHSVFLPYDMDFYLPPGLNMYTVVNNVVSNYPKAPSDNGRPNYLKALSNHLLGQLK